MRIPGLLPRGALRLAAGLLLAIAGEGALAGLGETPDSGGSDLPCTAASPREHARCRDGQGQGGLPPAAPLRMSSPGAAPARSTPAANPFLSLAAERGSGTDLADHDARAKGRQRGKGKQAERDRERDDWERLSPRQRERLEERRHRFRELPPQQQRRLLDARERFQRLPPQERARLLEKWRELPPEERRRWRESESEPEH
jgi:hypothetical protein